MTTDDMRRELSQIAGVLEYLRASLSRVEHGQDRATIKHARSALQVQADTLLLLRARIGVSQEGQATEAGR
jgi:hypothetical protein